jgi:hypothetical protein
MYEDLEPCTEEMYYMYENTIFFLLGTTWTEQTADFMGLWLSCIIMATVNYALFWALETEFQYLLPSVVFLQVFHSVAVLRGELRLMRRE